MERFWRNFQLSRSPECTGDFLQKLSKHKQVIQQSGVSIRRCWTRSVAGSTIPRYTNLPSGTTTSFPESLGSGRSQSHLGVAGSLCLPSCIYSGQGGHQATAAQLSKDNLDSPRVAEHALDLGSDHNVFPDTSTSSPVGHSVPQPFNRSTQRFF